VDKAPPLPANLQGLIRSVGLVGGGASMNLELVGTQPEGHLVAGQELPAKFIGLDLLPPEFAELAAELKKTSQQLRESNVITDLDETVKSTRVQIEKAGRLMDSFQEIAGDQKLRDDLRASLANIRAATENTDRLSKKLETVVDDAGTTVKSTQAHIDDLARQMSDRLEQASKILASFQSISAKIDNGKGTAGLLVNDPKLYAGLVDTVQQLNLTIKDLQRLAQQWEQEGVSFKLAK
jgi:ABC-type transporter Mla subunit MlaD